MRGFAKQAWAGIGVGLCGFAIALASESVHRRLDTDASYVSFCNVSSAVNCDRVLGSEWAELGGVSVSLLAILFYLVFTGLAASTLIVPQAPRRRQLARLLFLQSIGGLAFSLYMASVAVFALGTVCLMCGALYVVAIAGMLCAWSLQRALRPLPRRGGDGSRAGGADRRAWVAGVACLILLVGMAAWSFLTTETPPQTAEDVRLRDPEFVAWFEAQPVKEIDGFRGNVRGEVSAPVTLVEFSDFECGHCRVLHRSLADLWREQGGRVRIVFRHFPLDSECNASVPSRFHRDACLAAAAAECAGEQGKFWEYHDVLFRHQEALDREALFSYARSLDLAPEAFRECVAGRDAAFRVRQDTEQGVALGVSSTPTLFVNGRMIPGALDLNRLRQAVLLAAEGR